MRQDESEDEVGRGGRARALVCDVHGLRDVDVSTLDALARLHLAARRSGFRLELINISPALRELLRFSGLTEVFGDSPAP